PVGVDELERKLLFRRVVPVALLVEASHDLDDAAGLFRFVERQVRRQRLLKRGQAEAHEGQRQGGSDPVAAFHDFRSSREIRRSSRQRYTKRPTQITTLTAARYPRLPTA